jgi:hypothetical protein
MTRNALRIIALLILSTGCTPASDRAEVTGQVLVNGQPLESGSISFSPTEGNDGPTAGGKITNGSYAIDSEKGVVPGKNRVAIRGMKKTGRQVTRYTEPEDEIVQFLPPEYNDQSTLVRDVEPGENAFDFELVVDD